MTNQRVDRAAVRSETGEPALDLLGGTVRVSHEFILSNCYATETDIVIATSSLVEGMGNRYSDLDIYVLCDDLPHPSAIHLDRHHRVLTREREIVTPKNAREFPPSTRVYLVHTVVPGTEIKVDVEFLTVAAVRGLFQKVHELWGYACHNLELLTRTLTDREKSFMHRIFSARPISDARAFEKLVATVNPAEFSSLAYRWLASDFSVLLDIAGAFEARQWVRCVELCRQNVIVQTLAYLHLFGVTNTDPKWMLHYLPTVLCSDPQLVREFFDFYYLRGVDGPDAVRTYAIATLDYVDELYRRSRPLLRANACMPSGARALEILAARFGGTRKSELSRFAELEYLYRARVYDEVGFKTSSLLTLSSS